MKRFSLAWLAAAALHAAPAVFFVDLPAGPKTGGPGNQGAPISIFGKGFGAERGSGKVTIGGVEVSTYLAWGHGNATHKALDMITVQPGAKVTGGPIVVTNSAGEASKEAFSFTVNNGRILYMAPNGKDGKCSEDSPCKTVMSTFGDKAKPGDLVLARGGNYDEGEIWLHESNHHGTATARKTLKAYPGEQPTWTNRERGFVAGSDYATFSGLHFRNGKSIGIPDAGAAGKPKGVWIINSSVVGPIDYDGMSSHGDDHMLAGNYVEVKGSSQGTQGHCYYISFGSNTKILYNYGSGAPGYGLHLYDQPRQNNDFKRVMSNILVEGNVLTGSTRRAGILMVMDDHGYGAPYGNAMENVIVRNNILYANNQIGIIAGGGTGAMRDIKIYNNTVYENGMVGIYIAKGTGAASGFEVKNNLIVQTDKSRCNDKECGGCCSWYELAHVIADPAPAGWAVIENNGYFPARPLVYAMNGKRAGALADAKAVTGAVKFKDAAAGDFRVLTGAPLDRGLALPASPRDFDGVARPVGAAADLGAFESAGSGKAEDLAPPPPSGVPAPVWKEAAWGSLALPAAGAVAALGLLILALRRSASAGR